jgi:hypothetical protein
VAVKVFSSQRVPGEKIVCTVVAKMNIEVLLQAAEYLEACSSQGE